MTIREYKEGEHKAGFIGLRVVVPIGGKYNQKYFNFKKLNSKEKIEDARKEAQALNNAWNMERSLVSHQRKLDCRENRRSSSAYTTGVSGIKMKFAGGRRKSRSKDKRKANTYTNSKYYSAIFLISGSTDGIRFNKVLNITKLGYDLAWFKAITYYAEKKNMANYSHLLERKPPVEQFYVIYKYQQSQGHDIPLRRLPKELDPNVLATT